MKQETPQLVRQPFRNVFIPGDTNGTGFWRFLAAVYSMYCLPPEMGIQNSIEINPPGDPNWWMGVNMVMVQRMTTKYQLEYLQFLDAIRKQNGMTIIYNIDDCMHPDEIPLQNKGRSHYAQDCVQKSIKDMLDIVDYVLVTTDRIREYYSKKYSLPIEKIICIPDLMPRWWIDGKFDPRKKVEDFKKHKKTKLRIGIISSASHWNVDKLKDENGNLIKDDFDEIADAVKSTCKTFDWNIIGYCPYQVEEEVKRGDIRIHPPCPILNYPEAIRRLDLDVIVVPCNPNLEFNKCKANIKFLEGCAIGVPVLAQNVDPTYTRHMPKSQLFNDGDELRHMLVDLQTISDRRFESIIESQWKFLNSSTEEAGHNLRNWWLEDNLGIWVDICRIPQRTTPFKAQYQDEMNKKNFRQVWSNEDKSCGIFVNP